MKIKTIIFNFITFSLLLTPIIHAASDLTDQQLLLNAAKTGNLEGLKKSIEGAGMDPNTANSKGQTLLIVAADYNNVEIVKYLLEREDVNPDLQDNLGYTALIWASYKGFENIIKLLLEHNANPNLQNNKGHTALLWASFHGHDKVVEVILPYINFDLQSNKEKRALGLFEGSNIQKMISEEMSRRKKIIAEIPRNQEDLISEQPPRKKKKS